MSGLVYIQMGLIEIAEFMLIYIFENYKKVVTPIHSYLEFGINSYFPNTSQ